MAKVYNNGGDLRQPIVMEDPRTANDGFWLWGRRHDKDTLTPQYNKAMNWATENSGFATFGDVNYWQNRMDGNSYYAGQNQLLLSKMTVHCSDWYNDTTNYYNIPDDAAWRYMDSVTEDGQSFTTWTEYDNGAGTKRMAIWNSNGSSNRTETMMYGHNQALTSDQNLDEVRVTESVELSYWRGALTHPSWTDNGYIYAMAGGGSTSSSSSAWAGPNYYWLYAGNGWPTSYSNVQSNPTIAGNLGAVQVLGHSLVDGKPITVSMSHYANTGAVKITKHTFSGSSVYGTELAHLQQTAPTAAGTHAGGNNLNGDAFWSTCSKTFTDPRDSNKKAFYRTYFDTSGDFHPLVVTWDTTDDSFLIENDISITGNKSSVHANLLVSTFDTSGFKSDAILTETWATSGNRYVGYIPIDNKGTDTDSAKRTVIVYTMNSADPTALTYHSKVTFATVARNIVWLNDARTLLGVFFKDNFKIYSFSDGSGWTETTEIGFQVTSCGRDADDRIWYVKEDPELGNKYPALYLLTPTLPVSVTVTPELASYTYSGSNITSYIDVSALDTSGTRLATSVKLVIEGSSMTFTDGTTTKTVTTLTSGELQVGTTITGSGYTNVTASVVV